MKRNLELYRDGHFVYVDQVALRAAALALQQQIRTKVPVDDDPYGFHTVTLPYVEASITGQISNALDDVKDRFLSGNYTRDEMEGTLPVRYDETFTDAVSDFYVEVLALPKDEVQLIENEGQTYAWRCVEE